ncbi:hypothetical protein ACFL1G_02820 [Planctomycetota bacterium]
MKNIEGRIKTIEKKLQVNDKADNEPIVIELVKPNGVNLFEPVEEWITYKEQLKQKPSEDGLQVIIVKPEEELEARRQRKATKNNQYPKS